MHRRPQFHFLEGSKTQWCSSPCELLKRCAHFHNARVVRMTRQHMRCTEITQDLCMCSIDSLGDNMARRSLSISTISTNASRSRSRECRHLPHLTCPLRARCIPFGTAHKVSKLSPRIKLSGHARARVLRRERQHQSR